MARNKPTTTTVVVSVGMLLTIGAMLVAAPSTYAEKTCIGACHNKGDVDQSTDNSVDNSGQTIDNSVDNSVDSHDTNNIDNSVDSHDTNNIDNSVCTAHGGSVTGGGSGGGGGTGGAGGCNSL
jgi:hypothetical protein